MNVKLIAAGVASLVALIVVITCWSGLVGYCDYHDYQIYQSVGGEVTVIDHPGYYSKFFGSTWTYPKAMEVSYAGDDAIKATFNDGGTAMVATYSRIQLPIATDHRLLLHQQFNGTPDNIKPAVKAHLENCVKAAGPIMSASENQASRKGEFNQIIEEQLSSGLFKTRRTEIELDDLSTIEETGVAADGSKIVKEKKARVQATEIVTNKDGHPIVIQPSPLKTYGIGILQFSVTDIDYDKTTLEQFSAKKKSYLAAEQAKAERQQEVQQRLMIEEKGRRQVAEVQAEFNQKKEQALIEANQAAEVAVITKEQAVTAALQKVEVASKQQAEAETLKNIAAIKAQTAELDKKAKISAAEAQQKSIELGGGITEKDRVLAEIKAGRDEKVAAALAGLKVPNIVIGGGGGGSGAGGNDTTTNLINIKLLEGLGILDPVAVTK